MSSSSAPSGTVTPTITPGLDALLHRAAYAPIQNTGWIRVTGSDRVRWLNGMVTNNIAALQPGEGNYNFFLNAQGRIQGDCTAWMQSDCILLETAADRILGLMALLEHFIIMDDVELADVTNERAGVVIIGPQTEAILDKFVTGEPVLPPILHIIQMQRIRHNDLLLHAESPQVPRFELWLQEPGDADTLKRELKEGGISEASDEDLEHLRILSGTPLYGTDIRDKDLPQETNQTRALHFAKGCYLGQEIVERIRSRGQVHRTFTGFVLAGDLPQPGTALTDENAKAVGELTSVTTIGGQMLALGYLRREARDRGALIQYPGGTATPSEVPFSLAITSGNEPSHHVR